MNNIKDIKTSNSTNNNINNNVNRNQFNSRAIRPLTFDDFIGQTNLVTKLKVALVGSLKRQKPVPHILLTGPAGTGKTTLAQIIANEAHVKIIHTMGMHIKTDEDLLEIIKDTAAPDRPNILFIDEIHEIKPNTQEKLFTLMEDGFINIKIKDITVKLNPYPFTIIGATTDPGKLLKPLYSRFDLKLTLELYMLSELEQIVKFRMKKEGFTAEPEAITAIAKRSQGTAREIGKFTNLVIDMHYALGLEKTDTITLDTVESTFQLHGIDREGLRHSTEIKYLKYLVTIYPNKIGLDNVTQVLNEDKTFLEKQVEPFLIRKRFITRGRGGRCVTKKGIDYLLQNNYITEKDIIGV